MKRKNIVTIGGGTGSFMLLRGLKKYPINLSAIVSMADDGGSAGVLRDELGVLPPGDARQCLTALSDSSEMLRKLMDYRFEGGKLKGHTFGNLFLSALEKINGGFYRGVEAAAKILDVKGEVIPVSEENMRLRIELNSGKILAGENQLDHNIEVRSHGIKRVFLRPQVRAHRRAVEKILSADFVIIGPGDLHGSIIPNLIVTGISEAVRKTKAKIIFNCNLTNKKGQTENFSLDDYVNAVEKYIGRGRIGSVVFNNKKLNSDLADKYEKREGRSSIVRIKDAVGDRSYEIISADVLNNKKIRRVKSDAISSTRSFIRHDSDKLAKVLMNIFRIKFSSQNNRRTV